MASYQDGSTLDFSHGHKREQSQDSGAYIDWNSEDSASPVGNPENNGSDDFVTVVAVENSDGDSSKEATSFVTILAIGNSEESSKKDDEIEKEEEVLVYRLPGERLGFGLKFDGGTNTAENVKRLFIQSSAPDSPASRAKCSWGSLVEGDEILQIDGHIVKNMTRLDCVRCLKESSVVIKLYVKHKNQKESQKPNTIKVENGGSSQVTSGSSLSPMVISAEMKKNIPPPPPVPPRKIAKKALTSAAREDSAVANSPESLNDSRNSSSPVPKVRNIQAIADESSKNLSKFVIKVPQRASHESPDLSKRVIKKNSSDLKLVPPEPKVYLDLFAQEDSKNCESESDDTGSTISTVVGLSTVSNTTNSSFSDLRSSASSFCDSTNSSTPTSEPTTPVLDLSRLLTPYEHTDNNEFLFTKLINGKDVDSISYDEKISLNGADDIAPLQPPLSFQDAPLSYGNEEMRANLTDSLEVFQDDVTLFSSKNHQEEFVSEPELSLEGKYKDSKATVLTKKPSLIPRLAKSIGLLSPPKPNPRKEPSVDGNKLRFHKKRPSPLPPVPDTIQNLANESVEGKTLKSSIPYLKKKKVKNDEMKKNSKNEKKSKSFLPLDETDKGKSILLPNNSETSNVESFLESSKEGIGSLKTPEADRQLTWEVPHLRNTNDADTLEVSMSQIDKFHEGSEESSNSNHDSEDFLLNLGNGELKCGDGETSESLFLFSWPGPKHLETIGEDEEDFSIEEGTERYGNSDKREEVSSPQIVPEIEEKGPTKSDEISYCKPKSFTNREMSESSDTKIVNDSTEVEEKRDETEKFDEGLHTEDNAMQEKSTRENLEVKKDESQTNDSKLKNGLCNNHVLVKLDNDLLEVDKNVQLNASNGEVKDVMVPVESTTIGEKTTSIINRTPPDGHDFSQNYSDESLPEDLMTVKIEDDEQEEATVVLPPLPASEPPSTPSAKGSLTSIGEMSAIGGYFHSERTATRPARNSFWRQDEKSEKSVRDKIAMFSSIPDSTDSPSNGLAKLNKYKSSEDVFYCDEVDANKNLQNGRLFSRSILSLDKVSNGSIPNTKKISYGSSVVPSRSLDFSNRTQSSIDLSTSSSAYSSSCSPDSSLSSTSSYLGYSSTLPRKKNREENNTDNNKKDTGIHRTTSFSLHGRSQSLLDFNPSPFTSRYSTESPQDDSSKPGSLNLLIEQRRKNLSKLRGLVIPEKLSETVPNAPIVDLPEIKSRDLIIGTSVPNLNKEKLKMSPKWEQRTTRESSTPKVSPAHLWDIQSKTPNIPKYSPAFKRKSISVFASKEPYNLKKEVQSPPKEVLKAPVKPPRNIRQNFTNESRKYVDGFNSSDGELPEKFLRPIDIYVPKRKLVPSGKSRLHSDFSRSEEDSDNDSAVSSSRSSISHGFSPPASPILDSQYPAAEDSANVSGLLLSPEKSSLTRTLSSETTASAASVTSTVTSESQTSISSNDGSDANSKRILKPQSVEAINRKNVLASAKYSRGFDAKSGSPLIQRKFTEQSDVKIDSLNKNSDAKAITNSLYNNDNLYQPKKSSADSNCSSDIKTETSEKSTTTKIAYITDVVDEQNILENITKKKLEKSESLPSEPSAVPLLASRKTSVPFSCYWENGNNWEQSNRKQVETLRDNYAGLKDVSSVSASHSPKEKSPTKGSNPDQDMSWLRLKSEKTSPVTNSCSSSNYTSNDAVGSVKVETKNIQLNVDNIPSDRKRSVSVNDIRKTFEKTESPVSNFGRLSTNKTLNSVSPGIYSGVNGNHVRVSSFDSTTSEDNCALVHGLSGDLQREKFGSITSLASSTSLISPQELQLLIEEANQTLEESASVAGGFSQNSHDVLVIILHRDSVGGSVGITLAGGADYESKEITVHKVLAGSPADRDGRIQKGDRILSINGKSMKGVTHRESLAILKAPRLEVVLVVSRLKADVNAEHVNPDDATPVSARHSYFSGSSRPPRILEGAMLTELDERGDIQRGPPVTFTLVKDGAGLGFSLEGGKDCPTGDKPLVIKKIFTGGAAEKSGQLKAGDELLNVNGIDVFSMSRIEVWKLMKQLPDGNVNITVKHQVEKRSNGQS